MSHNYKHGNDAIYGSKRFIAHKLNEKIGNSSCEIWSKLNYGRKEFLPKLTQHESFVIS